MARFCRIPAAPLERLRQAQRMSFRDLSARLAEYGRPILPSGLHRQAQGGRRTDADDLVVFAAALGVTPADLLAPPGEGPAGEPVPEHAAAAAARQLADRIETLLEAAGDPAAREFASGSVDRALRRVQIEVEELLEEAAAGGRLTG